MSATNPQQELNSMEDGINLINSTLNIMKFTMRMLQEENEKLKEQNHSYLQFGLSLQEQIKEVDKILDNQDLDDRKMIRSIIKALNLQLGANSKFKQTPFKESQES